MNYIYIIYLTNAHHLIYFIFFLAINIMSIIPINRCARYDMSPYVEHANCTINNYDVKYIQFDNVYAYSYDIFLKDNDTIIHNGVHFKHNIDNLIHDIKINNAIDTPVLYISYYEKFKNFLHFLYDLMPYCILFKYIKENIEPKLKMLIDRNVIGIVPNYVNDIFNFYDIKCKFKNGRFCTSEDIMAINIGQTKFSKIYFFNADIMSKPDKLFIYHPFLIDNYINKTKQMISQYKSNIQTYDYIYISRRGNNNTNLKYNSTTIGENNVSKRCLVNENEIVKKLNEHDFKEIFLENYSFADKLYLLNNAKIIITTMGAGAITFLFLENKQSNKNITKNIIVLNNNYFMMSSRFKYYDQLNNTNTDIFNIFVKDKDVKTNMPWKLDITKFNEQVIPLIIKYKKDIYD